MEQTIAHVDTSTWDTCVKVQIYEGGGYPAEVGWQLMLGNAIVAEPEPWNACNPCGEQDNAVEVHLEMGKAYTLLGTDSYGFGPAHFKCTVVMLCGR